MITAWIADGTKATKSEPDAACAALAGGAGHVWLDFEGESEAEVHRLLRPLGVHPLVLEDMVTDVNRPKVDDYGDYLYLVVHSARWEKDESRPSTREIDIIVGPRVLATYHDGDTRSVASAATVLTQRPELLAKSPAHLLHYVLDVLVDHYLPIMDQIADHVDSLEEAVFEHDGREMYERIIHLKRGIAAMRRIVGPQRDTILALTRDEFRAIPPEMRPYLRDVYDRLARVSDLLDSFRDEIAGLLELHVSVVSNRMNEVMKRLTVITTIFMPLSFVTGYFGMNLKMAEFDWTYGQWWAFGLLLATGFGTWWDLRSRRWF